MARLLSQRYPALVVSSLLLTMFLVSIPPTGQAFAQASLASTYQGTAHNITFDITTTLALTDVVQEQQNISGKVIFGSGLLGTGTFTGTIGSNGTISFTDIPTDGARTIFFEGVLHTDGSLSGTYSVPDVNQQGTWQVVPASPPTFVDLQAVGIQALQPLVAGSNPTFRATIQNNGSAASGNFNIRWIADGKNFDGGHYSILAGATDTHDHIWSNITPGNHTLTFIANFDHGVTESDYSNNRFTLTFTVASPKNHQKLFILIQGINSTLSPEQAKNLTVPVQYSFGKKGGIYPFLKSAYKSTVFKMFSYNGADSIGNPTSYNCEDTFTQHLTVYVARLKTQIINYLNKNSDTDVYLIGHSMGGAVALGLLADMKINGFINVNGGKVAGVVSLDSPLGGTDPLHGVNSWFTKDNFKKVCPALVPKHKPPLPLFSLDDLFKTFAFGGGTPHGGMDSIMLVINGGDFSNQEVVAAAARANLPVLTIGTPLDFTYTNGCPLTVSNFPSTQWVADQGNNSGVYGRIFPDKRALLKCTDPRKQIADNHFLVFTNTLVEKGLQQFVDGKTPDALVVAPNVP